MTEHQKKLKHAANRRYYGKTEHLYIKRRWRPEEVAMVMEHSIPDSELSEKIMRSVKAIQEKRRLERKKLNK